MGNTKLHPKKGVSGPPSCVWRTMVFFFFFHKDTLMRGPSRSQFPTLTCGIDSSSKECALEAKHQNIPPICHPLGISVEKGVPRLTQGLQPIRGTEGTDTPQTSSRHV